MEFPHVSHCLWDLKQYTWYVTLLRVYQTLSEDISTNKIIRQTGAGTSMSRLGWADLGLATQNDMAAQADMLANLDPSVPMIADADTGYGGPTMVARTLAKYARAGVAAMHLEDQVQEKRCGHLLGKEIVSREVYFSRIRAAVNARSDLGVDIMIIARTDSRQIYGFEDAYERLRGAVEIGADAVFPEAMESKEEAAEMVRRLADVPCLLNMVPSGVTPEITTEEAKEMGFRLMIFPAIGFEGAMHGIRSAFEKLKAEGRQPLTSLGVKEGFELCGLQQCVDLDKRAGGKAYASV
jgi:2-methylisocitrate lyase-like PEP mutase family enzyme